MHKSAWRHGANVRVHELHFCIFGSYLDRIENETLAPSERLC